MTVTGEVKNSLRGVVFVAFNVVDETLDDDWQTKKENHCIFSKRRACLFVLLSGL